MPAVEGARPWSTRICDLNQLEAELKQAAVGAPPADRHRDRFSAWTATRRRCDEIVELAEKYDAMVMVDEAHGTGVYRRQRRRGRRQVGSGDRVLVQMGTLGKALGGFGAYVAGSRALRDLLINRCRSFIFTTSLPPAVMAMALAAIDLVQREPERRAALRR